MKFLVLITYNDLLEMPTNAKVIERRIIDADKSIIATLKRKFDKVFNEHGDGNDEFYDIHFISLNQRSWSVDQAEKWLDKFKVDNDVGSEQG